MENNFMKPSSLKKLIIIGVSILVLLIWAFIAFDSVNTATGFETVVVDKPYIFGSNKIRKVPLTAGRQYIWFSSDAVQVETKPIQHEEEFDDMTTSDNIYVDFHAFLRTRVLHNGSPYLLEKFGLEYYKNNIQQVFREAVRDEISKYAMTPLTTRSENTKAMKDNILRHLNQYLTLKKIPVEVEDINFGKILPNKNVLDELNRTAEQQQRKQTEINTAAAEDARKNAETKRAEADNAYRNALGLSPEQFVQLQQIEMMRDASKNGANVFLDAPAMAIQKR